MGLNRRKFMRSLGFVGVATIVPATAVAASTPAPTGKTVKFGVLGKLFNRLVPVKPFALEETVFVCGIEANMYQKELTVLVEECEVVAVCGKGKEVVYQLLSKISGTVYVDVSFAQAEYVSRTWEEAQRKGIKAIEDKSAQGKTLVIQNSLDQAIAAGFKAVPGGLMCERKY